VNDDPAILMMMESLFKMSIKLRPENLAKAQNGEEAFMLAKQIQYDIIIMDLNMPVMDGFEACKKIKDFFSDPSFF